MSHTATHRPRVRTAAAAVAVTVALVACGGESADDHVASVVSSDSSTPEYGLVTPGEAAVLATADDVEVIDVRTPEEFAEGHIDGAVMIDFYADSFADDIAALDPDATYLVYCRSGNRSGQTTALMAELGFDQVYDLDGGVIAWDAQGGALVR